jgi:hypothetical protein
MFLPPNKLRRPHHSYYWLSVIPPFLYQVSRKSSTHLKLEMGREARARTHTHIYTHLVILGKGTAIPVQACTGRVGSRRARLPNFNTVGSRRWQGCRALSTGRLYSPGNIPGTRFSKELSRLQGHSAAARIVSMKNSNDTNGDRTRDFPACSSVHPW